MPAACAAASTSSADRGRHRDRELAAAALAQLVDRDAVEELHDDVRRAVVGHVVVDHAHDPRVLHGVGRVAFAAEARHRPLVARELGEEHLDREFGAVSVRRLVDDGHPADAQDGVEAVLPADQRPDALPRPLLLRVVLSHERTIIARQAVPERKRSLRATQVLGCAT
jgi:hypothetical protein